MYKKLSLPALADRVVASAGNLNCCNVPFVIAATGLEHAALRKPAAIPERGMADNGVLRTAPSVISTKKPSKEASRWPKRPETK